jgi:FkbM family methyltransferase
MTAAPKLARRLIRLAGQAGLPISTKIRSGVGQGLRISLLNATREHLQGSCEIPVQRCLRQHLAPGGIFLDVGANIGFFSLIGARLAGPHGKVFAIEPVPENTRCIVANAKINGFTNVQVIAAAAGEDDRQGRLFIADHSGGATLSVADMPPDLVNTLTVPVFTIDHFVETGRIDPPTFVKIDVEGTEMAVLEGMAGTLGRHRPAIVYEVDDRDPAQAEEKFAAIARRLEAFHYRVQRLDRSYQGIAWTVLHGLATISS